jgi:malonyl CoA-acyl carrier protein transacylase
MSVKALRSRDSRLLTIVEVGPKRVLSGLIRNIRKDLRLVFVGDAESLGRCGELLCAA